MKKYYDCPSLKIRSFSWENITTNSSVVPTPNPSNGKVPGLNGIASVEANYDSATEVMKITF